MPDFSGEPAGTRTQDHLIKSQVLYQLSYGLSWACVGGTPCAVNSPSSGAQGALPRVGSLTAWAHTTIPLAGARWRPQAIAPDVLSAVPAAARRTDCETLRSRRGALAIFRRQGKACADCEFFFCL